MAEDQKEYEDKLRASLSEIDRVEESGTQGLLRSHVLEYFAASQARRVQVSEEIERAERENTDIFAGDLPWGEWRHKWPLAARNAIRALWRTPKDQ